MDNETSVINGHEIVQSTGIMAIPYGENTFLSESNVVFTSECVLLPIFVGNIMDKAGT